MAKPIMVKIRNAAIVFLTFAVFLGILWAESYQEEANRMNYPELNCQAGWTFVYLANDVEACIRPQDETADFTILDNEAENARRLQYNPSRGWTLSGANYPE